MAVIPEDFNNHNLIIGLWTFTLNIRRVRSDNIEDVDEHKEESDQHRHAPGDNLWGYQKAGPGHHHKQPAW